MSDWLSELTELFVAAAPRLTLLLVQRYGISYDFAHDILQQTMLRLIERGGDTRFESGIHFEHFALRAALNAVVDDKRKNRRMTDDTALTLLSAVGPDAEEELIRQEQLSRLYQAIDDLTPRYRAVFKLLTEQELSITDIATVLGLEKASVYQRYERGLKMLRKKLKTRR